MLTLHLLPNDQARGAQTYARAMCEELNRRVGGEHKTLSIFAAAGGNLCPDIQLDARSGMLRRLGLDPRALWALSKLARRMRPTVVVAHGGEPLKYACAALPPSIPLAYYKIGVSAGRLHGPMHRLLYTVLLRRVERVAGVSSEAIDEAVHLFGVPAERTTLIPNGRSPSLFPPRQTPPDSFPPHLLFVGALTSSKRPEAFVRLIGRLRERGLDVRATIVGDGPDFVALRALASAHQVVLLGRRSDVPMLMREADLLVFPSERVGEGMPGVLIEAGLAGLPVVATRVPGVLDIVQDGVTGMTVGEHDEDGLFRATLTLALDPSLRRALGLAARRRCLEHFSLEESVRRWHNLLVELAAASQPIRSRTSRQI